MTSDETEAEAKGGEEQGGNKSKAKGQKPKVKAAE
jgi:hypothetical protein